MNNGDLDLKPAGEDHAADDAAFEASRAAAPDPVPAEADSKPELEEPAEIAKTADQKSEERQLVVDDDTRAAGEAMVGTAELDASEMMPFKPKSFDDAWKLAGHIAKSGIVNRDLRGNTGGVLAVMASGERLGIGWDVAVQVAHVVHGRVGWPAAILDGVCDSDPDFEYFEISKFSNQSATVVAKKHRWTKEREYTVTVQDAKDMGFLDGKHSKLWVGKRPMPMLIAMARREAARLWNPKRLAGIHTPAELAMKPPPKNVTPEDEKASEVRDGVGK